MEIVRSRASISDVDRGTFKTIVGNMGELLVHDELSVESDEEEIYYS